MSHPSVRTAATHLQRPHRGRERSDLFEFFFGVEFKSTPPRKMRSHFTYSLALFCSPIVICVPCIRTLLHQRHDPPHYQPVYIPLCSYHTYTIQTILGTVRAVENHPESRAEQLKTSPGCGLSYIHRGVVQTFSSFFRQSSLLPPTSQWLENWRLYEEFGCGL